MVGYVLGQVINAAYLRGLGIVIGLGTIELLVELCVTETGLFVPLIMAT